MPEPGELHRLIAALARFGGTPAGGVHRLCASPEDGVARTYLRDWLESRGATVRVDAVGNMFALFELAGPDAPLVMAGSHLDSQPKGGRYDGAAGVAAAACAALRLMEAREQGTHFAANLCVVNWTNEEGARFRPSLIGSGTYVGAFTADFALGRIDAEGVTLGAALAAIGFAGRDAAPLMPLAYIELHIEQGDRLERAGRSIGIVTRNWGAAKFEIVFTGEAAHTGPYPMQLRRDALLAAAHLIVGVRALADAEPGALHTSVARLDVSPNSANVVPDRVEASVELRASDDRVLDAAVAAFEALLEESAARAKVRVQCLAHSRRGIRTLPPEVGLLIGAAAERLGHPALALDTVAGHDAISLVGHCPVGLMFVPSQGGLSHNEREYTAPEHLDAGLDVMTDVLMRLCREGHVADAGEARHEAIG